jgi:hypothetical protein
MRFRWVIILGVVVAAGAAYLAMRSDSDGLAMPREIVDAVDDDCSRDNGMFSTDAHFTNRSYFTHYYSQRFSDLVEQHAHLESVDCEAAGGGATYYRFDSPRFLNEAVRLHPREPALCVFSATEMVDDDYVNSGAQQLAEICGALHGRVASSS